MSLDKEAEAFDQRIKERMQNGMIPDLRRTRFNEWFFNNPWRRPEFVDMIFGDYYRFAKSFLKEGSTILEVGSGLGHMSLELAREGFHVTGIELSPESVQVAKQTANENPYNDNFGSLEYQAVDFFNLNAEKKYDAILFFLTMHHFQNPDTVVEKAKSLLKEGGKIIVIEPARDYFSKRNAALVTLIRSLLSITGNWFKEIDIPKDKKEMNELVDEYLNEYRDAKDKNEQEQSPHDNDCYAKDMIEALDKKFNRQQLTYGNSITPRMLGGIRGENDDQVMLLASMIKLFDDYATENKLIEPGAFYYVGKNE